MDNVIIDVCNIIIMKFKTKQFFFTAKCIRLCKFIADKLKFSSVKTRLHKSDRMVGDFFLIIQTGFSSLYNFPH